MSTYTIGLDYGTDSVRSLIVNTGTGEEVATAVFYYGRPRGIPGCLGVFPQRCQYRHGAAVHWRGAGSL